MTRITMHSRRSLANLRVCGTGTDVYVRQRLYRNGSTLRDHLEVLETRVISGIVQIDSDLDGPFPIQIEGGTGVLASLDPKPGQLVFYESAEGFHQRSAPISHTHLRATGEPRMAPATRKGEMQFFFASFSLHSD